MSFSYYTAQYSGLVLGFLSIAVIYFGYDKGYMNNTLVCIVSAVFAAVGLILHELRPFNRAAIIDEIQADKLRRAAADKED